MTDVKKYGSKYWLNKLIENDSLNKELERIDGIRVIKGTGVPFLGNQAEKSLEKYLEDYGIINKENPFHGWWVDHPGKQPTWDYICQARISGREGLILLEAKAHRNETSKPKKPKPQKNESTSDYSFEKRQRNHRKIESNITSQISVLGGDYSGYYQVANRIAYTIKAREVLGRPVLLVFLGFINMDSHFTDRFMTQSDWESKMSEILKSLKLLHLTNTPIQDLSSSPGLRIMSYPEK